MKKKEFAVVNRENIYRVIYLYASYWPGSVIESDGRLLLIEELDADTEVTDLGEIVEWFDTWDEAYDYVELRREMEED